MTEIWQGKPPMMRQVDLDKYTMLLGAVCDHHHWTLVVIYPREKKALYLNPLGENAWQIEKCKAVTRAFLRKKGWTMSRWECSTVPHPKQQDSVSCGVFVCKTV
ncbi:lysine-specific demethylase 5B-like [Huso huso]|uniref:Lysine-specific demethylase 5B-like n=1 Tax=Huso huso TaxID=61971 RepID=A0ABR0YZ05_HUSHU